MHFIGDTCTCTHNSPKRQVSSIFSCDSNVTAILQRTESKGKGYKTKRILMSETAPVYRFLAAAATSFDHSKWPRAQQANGWRRSLGIKQCCYSATGHRHWKASVWCRCVVYSQQRRQRCREHSRRNAACGIDRLSYLFRWIPAF